MDKKGDEWKQPCGCRRRGASGGRSAAHLGNCSHVLVVVVADKVQVQHVLLHPGGDGSHVSGGLELHAGPRSIGRREPRNILVKKLLEAVERQLALAVGAKELSGWWELLKTQGK